MNLYKYCSWSGEKGKYTRENLANFCVYLAAADTLNDPFDYNPVIEVQGNLREKKLAMRRFLQGSQKCSKKAAEREIVRRIQTYPDLRTDEGYLRRATGAKGDMRRTTGVCSLTTNPHSPAMWSHYADNHQGICINYELPEMNPLRLPPGANALSPVSLMGVSYSDDRPIANVCSGDFLHQLFCSLLTKSKEWEYEAEYRLAVHGYVGKAYHGTFAVKGIIMGHRMNDEDRRGVKEFVAKMRSQPRLFQAVLNERKFSMDIVPATEQ